MSTNHVPASAPLGTGRYPVSGVVVVTSAEGGWHVSGVLYRQGDGEIEVHPDWPQRWVSDPLTPLREEWNYLANRVLDGSGGNGYTYELTGFEVEIPEHIDTVVTAMAAELVASTHGPFGEIAGTFNSADSTDDDFAAMPFVVLGNGDGTHALVATDLTPTRCTVTGPDGASIAEHAYHCSEHRQRAGARSWPLATGTSRITWASTSVDIIVTRNGHVSGPHPSGAK